MKKAPFRVLVKINLLNPSHDVATKVSIIFETTKKPYFYGSFPFSFFGLLFYTSSIFLPNASAMRLNTSMLVA